MIESELRGELSDPGGQISPVSVDLRTYTQLAALPDMLKFMPGCFSDIASDGIFVVVDVTERRVGIFDCRPVLGMTSRRETPQRFVRRVLRDRFVNHRGGSVVYLNP